MESQIINDADTFQEKLVLIFFLLSYLLTNKINLTHYVLT